MKALGTALLGLAVALQQAHPETLRDLEQESQGRPTYHRSPSVIVERPINK